MINRDQLVTRVYTVTAVEADIGTAVNQNYRRFIYKVKLTNLFAGANTISLGKRENGAVATDWMDYMAFVLLSDLYEYPEELKEDSAPIYIVEGGGDAGDSHLRAVGSAGDAYLTLWYIDAEA